MIAMGVLLVGAKAIPDDATSQATLRKHQTIVQVINCMRKRMSVDKGLSYNAAAKVCKSQVDNQSNNSAAVAVVVSDSAAKP